jgi:hypothetical protein
MSWTDSLSVAAVEELRELLDRLGAVAFETSLVLAIRIRMSGPIRREEVPAWVALCGPDVWEQLVPLLGTPSNALEASS